MLWLWALDNAPDGDLSKFAPEEIAEVSEWTKDAKTFVEALSAAGFLDNDNHLHDWYEYAGRLIEQRAIQREQSRLRQQKRRQKLKDSNEQVT